MIHFDSYNLRYLESLPPNSRRVESGWEFVEIDPQEKDYYRIIKGQFVLWSKKMERYEVYEVNEYTHESQLAPFIKQGRIFLLPSQDISEQ